MRLLLTAINSKFNHTNIAVRSICRHAENPDVIFDEWTINQNASEILRGIYSHKCDVILFSCYIWNIEIISKIIPDLKKILPEVKIAAGGPEISFAPQKYFDLIPELDFIIHGEGEETVKEISLLKNIDNEKLQNIPGIILKQNGKASLTSIRPLICNLDSLKFPYEDLSDKNKIYYYESSRGCPFSCSYCMSSLDKRVRFLSLERVYCDLKKFLDAKIPLVKFVDRTYNLNEERYLAIWKFILQNHNGITMFHFEIEAEFLSQTALDFLQTIPSGIMQFEIGVQSSNKKTLNACGRSDNIEKLAKNISQIPKTIHTHLDLIAGLPFEDLISFGESYNFVMKLKPDALQLGFLKILHGTSMEEFAKQNNWKWMKNSPYETLCTPFISFEEMLFLKDVEIVTDALWNSHLFDSTMNYIFSKTSPWDFISQTAKNARKDGILNSAKKTIFWFDYIYNFIDATARELLKFDYLKIGKTSCFPKWLNHIYNKENHLNAMNHFESSFDNRIEFAFSEYDEFSFNPLSNNYNQKQNTKILFVYERKNSSIKNCQIIIPELK